MSFRSKDPLFLFATVDILNRLTQRESFEESLGRVRLSFPLLIQDSVRVADSSTRYREYDWTTNKDKDTLTDYLKLIESSKTIGE